MRFNKFVSVFILLFISSVCSLGQTYNPNPQTWYVDAETIPCDNVDGECLLIKQPGQKEYEIFTDKIEGFNFVKGYQYSISVKQEIKQPPIAAGESVFKYVLLKIISQKSVNYTSNIVSNQSTTAAKNIRLDVNFQTVPCGGNYSETCLLVKETGKKEYEIWNASIYGFIYESGYNYTIEVSPVGDGNYYFVKEISKQKIGNSFNNTNTTKSTVTAQKIIGQTNIQTSSSLDGRWYLRKMKDTDGSSLITDDNVIWIDINTFRDKLDGFGACNTFNAVVKSDLKTSCLISKITSNYSNCGNIKLENLFYQLLEQVNKFEIKNGNLILSNQWNFLLGFTSNPNNKEEIPTTFTPPTIINTDNLTYATNTKNNTVSQPNTNEVSSTQIVQKTSKTTTSQDKEIEALKAKLKEKEIEEQKKLEAAKQAELEKQKQAAINAAKQAELERQQQAILEQQKKQQEIEELKKLLAEKESKLNNSATSQSAPKPKEMEEKNEIVVADSKPNDKPINKNTTYQITNFTPNNSNNIPDPDYPNRPYYLDGNELIKLERAEANFALKKKGIYRGVDQQVQVMKEESPIQFEKNKLPRFFIQINDEDVDPYDIIDLCKADNIGAGRRNFTFSGKTYGGRVKDVTGKIMQLDFKKIRKGLYEIIIAQDLVQGEYAFLPLGNTENQLSSVNSVKANCFGVYDPSK